MWVCGSAPPSSAASRLGSAPTGPTCPIPVPLLHPDWASEGSLLRPVPEVGAVPVAEGVEGEAAAGRLEWTAVGMGEAGVEALSEGYCLHAMEVAEEEAGGGGGDAAEAGALVKGEGAEEVRPKLRGARGEAVEELRPGLWREVEEEGPRVHLWMEEEGAAALCCGEEEGEAEEGHRGTEEGAVLASGAHSSQPPLLLSSR